MSGTIASAGGGAPGSITCPRLEMSCACKHAVSGCHLVAPSSWRSPTCAMACPLKLLPKSPMYGRGLCIVGSSAAHRADLTPLSSDQADSSPDPKLLSLPIGSPQRRPTYRAGGQTACRTKHGVASESRSRPMSRIDCCACTVPGDVAGFSCEGDSPLRRSTIKGTPIHVLRSGSLIFGSQSTHLGKPTTDRRRAQHQKG